MVRPPIILTPTPWKRFLDKRKIRRYKTGIRKRVRIIILRRSIESQIRYILKFDKAKSPIARESVFEREQLTNV